MAVVAGETPKTPGDAEVNRVVTETEKKTSLGRIGLPTEVASAVAFIASEAGGYISGTNFSVDGGRFGI